MLETAREFKDTLVKGGRFIKIKRSGQIEELVMRGRPLKESVGKGRDGVIKKRCFPPEEQYKLSSLTW